MASSILEEQIAELRAKFSNNKLKIIQNQGDYKLVIRLEMCDGEIFIRLYVPNTPETQTYVLISAKHDENYEISAQLQKILNSKITALKKSEDLNLPEFFTTAEEFLQNSNIGASTSKSSEDEKSKKSPKNRKRDKNGKEKETTKFSGMKPVSDVFNRIMWDEKIPSEKFLVGYLDRFIGVQEVPMKDFEGKDFATADPEEFGIPEHRIQYFKYKSEKVWDKKNKIDFIFGSTGATKSIFDVMKEEDERNP